MRCGDRNHAQQPDQLHVEEVDNAPIGCATAWAFLDALSLLEVFVCPFSTVKRIPKRAKAEYARVVRMVLKGMDSPIEATRVRFIKLYHLHPSLLLSRDTHSGKRTLSPAVLKARCARFVDGDWEDLFNASIPAAQSWATDITLDRRVQDVMSLVREGQLSRACDRLDPAAMAPLDADTLQKLRDLHPFAHAPPEPLVIAAAPFIPTEEQFTATLTSLPPG